MFKEVIWGIYTECFGFENKVIPPPPPPPHPPLLWKVKVTQSCPTLCNPMDCSPPVSSIHRIFKARILEWIAMPSSRGHSLPRDRSGLSCITGRFFTYLSHHGSPPAKHTKMLADSNQPCHTGTRWLHGNPALCLSSWTVASYWSL